MRQARSVRRQQAAGVSLAVHLLVLAGLYSLADDTPLPSPPPALDPVEVVLLDVSPPTSPPPATAPTPPDAEAVPDTTGAPPPTPAASDPPKRPNPRTSSGAGTATQPLPRPETQAGGLSLSGLRGSSRAAPPGPSGPPPSPSPGLPISPRPRPRPAGPEEPPPRRDTAPRSFEEAGFQRRKDGSYKKGKLSDPFVVIVEPDGHVRFRDRLAVASGIAIKPNIVTAQKLAGEEQFRTQKTRILRETAALRQALARRFARAQMNRELARLRTKLERVWEKADWTVKRRRRQLFLLWDECEEPGEDTPADDTLDGSRRSVGVKARAAIVAFINDTLPSGSEHAYPPAELAALNRERTSRQRFAPY